MTRFRCVSLSSLLNPRPLLRFWRISSPSSISTGHPAFLSSGANSCAAVVFPEPGNPVSHTTNPFFIVGHQVEGVYLPLLKVSEHSFFEATLEQHQECRHRVSRHVFVESCRA